MTKKTANTEDLADATEAEITEGAEDTEAERTEGADDKNGDTSAVGKIAAPEGTKRIKCTIKNQAGEIGKHPVFVRMLTEHGAYEAYIPRETAVEIPEYVYEFLIGSDGFELVAESVNGRTEMVQKTVNRFIVQKV